MSYRATVTLDQEAYEFLAGMGGDNKSAYINRLLLKEKQKALEQAIMKANIEEAEDLTCREELADWDETLSDGLTDE